MSVIAFDGKIIAADKQATANGLVIESTKLIRRNGIILGWTGATDYGRTLADWYLEGAKKDQWPKFQESDGWARLIVFDKELFFYEQAPTRIPVEHPFMAWGAGRDFAMAAMYLGHTATKAVEVASSMCDSCGIGIDCFRVGK